MCSHPNSNGLPPYKSTTGEPPTTPLTQSAGTGGAPPTPPTHQSGTAAPASPPAARTPPSALGNVQAATPEAGGYETSVPKDAAVLRDDLLARTIALFGQAEAMPYQPSSFPDYFQKLVERLKATCANEIVTVHCNATTNLCALTGAFNNIDESQWLFKENPWLASSACTTWRGILFIWLKMPGWRPPNCILPGGCMMITDGILPMVEIAGSVTYPDGFPVTHFGSTVKEIEFAKLRWPPNLLEEFLLMKLESQYGPLIYTNDPSNRPVLHLATAARFFVTRLNLRYCYRTDSFIMSDADGLAGLARQDLAALILDWLGKKTANAGIAAPGDALVADVISEIIKITAIGVEEGLRRFLDQYVERRMGGSVTMAELLAAYQCTCEDAGAAMLPARKFYREVTDACRRRFGVAKSHDIRRSLDGKETAKSGFRNLTLKRNSPDTSDGSETSDTSDASGGLAK